MLPKSLATAASVCAPIPDVAVFQVYVNVGPDPVTSGPRVTPSRRNCTPATPTLSVAEAETVTVPATVAPSSGTDMETTGGIPSGGGAPPPTGVFMSFWISIGAKALL